MNSLGAAPADATTCSCSACSTTRSPAIRPCASTSAGTQSKTSNLGVGGYDAAERGYATEDHGDYAAHPGGRAARPPVLHQHARVTSAGPTRAIALGVRGPDDPDARRVHDRRPAAEGRDAARRRSTCSPISTTCAGIHSVRTGLQVDGGTYHSDDSTNYLGTYTFESLDAFRAGTPRSFTQRTGDPNIDYKNIQAGVYLQDDIRVRKNLTFSPGCATSCRRTCRDVQQLRTALRHHLVAGQERQDDPARQRRASSTTGCRPAPTSRRCAWTASGSAR